MLDSNLLRKNLPEVVARLATRKFQFPTEKYEALEGERKAIQTETEELQARRNQVAKKIGAAKKAGEDATELLKEGAAIAEGLAALEGKNAAVKKALNDLLLTIPNLPDPSVPVGKDETENVEVRRWGTPREFDFEIKDHVDVGGPLGLDFDVGAKLAGTRFCFMKGQVARLHRALAQFMLDTHTQENGYTECYTPYIANQETLIGTGQLPKFEEDLFAAKKGGQEGEGEIFYLIPTSEVTLTNSVRGQMLKESDLPIKITAQTPCFRSEAGSYGKDVRGLNRLHEFSKVELVRIDKPEHSKESHQQMLDHVEGLLQKLELPYRILRLCGGDMSFTAALCFDFEVYSEAQKRWLEVSSVSNFDTYQANRLKCRYRSAEKKTELCHTLNGSALALPRIVAALLENNQTPEGIRIPKALVPYCGFDMID